MEIGNVDQLELSARELDASDRFRVLRRLQPRQVITPPDGTPTHLGLFVDVETTGLNPSQDEIIELAIVPLAFGKDGRIFELRKPFQQWQQPAGDVPPEVTRLTGLTANHLQDRQIDLLEVARLANVGELVVAHRAAFDRPFLERLCPVFKSKPWGCSMTDVDWRSAGFESTKLEYLAMRNGFFFDGHQAMMDCFAGIELLSSKPTGTTAMKELIETAVKPRWTIGVFDTPFKTNAVLRERDYSWSPASESSRRGWVAEVIEERLPSELAFLRDQGFRDHHIGTKRVTAFDRFTARSIPSPGRHQHK